MTSRKLLEALEAAEASAEERFVPAGGELLVWSLRRSTWHPLLADALGAAPGLLLVSGRALPEGDVLEEVRGCRRAFADGSGPQLPWCRGGAGRGAEDAARAERHATSFEYGLLEERLEHIDAQTARRLLTEIIRAGVRLTRPVVIAVGGEGTASRRHATVYMGARMRPPGAGENSPPGGGGADVVETISVTRPIFTDGQEVTVGDLLCRCRGAASRHEVQLRAWYDHHLAPCAAAGGGAAAAGAAYQRLELLPGPFISLELTWSMDYGRAVKEPFARPPASVLGGELAVVHIRGSCRPDARRPGAAGRGLPLHRDLVDLSVLDRLSDLARSPHLAGDEALQPPDRLHTQLSEETAVAAVARFLDEEERRAAASAASLGGGASGLQPRQRKRPHGDAGEWEDEEESRPGRDFVDRLWLEVLSRCATTKGLVAATQALLEALGRPGGVAPFVRRTNETEAAGLVRLAVKMSTLRRYAAPSEAGQVQAIADEWLDKRHRFSDPRRVVALAAGAGVECLGRDFVHLITCHGSVTAQDLGPFSEAQPTAAAGAAGRGAPDGARLQRLRCLRHVAELATLAARHRFCADSLRRLVLKAVDFYQRPIARIGMAAPIFSVPLSRASSSCVLASLPAAEASNFTARCGGAFVRAERCMSGPSRRTGMDDVDTEESLDSFGAVDKPEPGVWCLPGRGLRLGGCEPVAREGLRASRRSGGVSKSSSNSAIGLQK